MIAQKNVGCHGNEDAFVLVTKF